MKINGSWAILPGILAVAVLPITVLVNIAPQTLMGMQFTLFAIMWVAGWGMVAAIGWYADWREWLKSARYPFFEQFIQEWLHRS